jgi:hypothetical protein
MSHDKKKRAQPSKKRKQQKQVERAARQMNQRREGPGETGASVEPAQVEPRPRRRPGEGLDKSDEGVIAGGRLAGRRFTG